jgi:cell shape-determining protein MreC
MSATSELVERLEALAEVHFTKDAKQLRAAALRLAELERENARLREALTFVVETRDCNHLTSSDTFRDYYAQSCPICKGRAALAGSGEK